MVLRTSGSSALADVDHQTRPNTFGADKKDAKAANSAAAKDQLRNNEDLASGSASTVAASGNANQNEIDESRAAENEPDFINSVAGRNEKDKGKSSFAKRRAPLLIILGMIFGGGGLMFGMQSLMPFSLLEQLRTKFDSLSTVSELRSNAFLKYQLDETEVKNPKAKKYYGETFKVSNKQKNKLSKQGIDVEEIEVDGKKRKVMIFDDGSGTRKIVAADSTTADLIKNKLGGATEISTTNGTKYKVSIADTVDFNTKYNDSADFRNGYIKSSRTWRGAVGAWFDSITLRFLQSNNLTRNRFQSFQERVKSEAAGNTKSMANELINKSASDLSATTKKHFYTDENGNERNIEIEKGEDGKFKYYYTDFDADGNEMRVSVDGSKVSESTNTNVAKVNTSADVKQKMDEIKKSVGGDKVTGLVNAGVNMTCTVFDVIGSIEILIAAQETMQVVQIASSYFEAIDKAKTSESADSPINDIANNLTMPTDTKIRVSSNDDAMDVSRVEFYDTTEETVRTQMNAMQSSGIASIYTSQRINSNDASVQNFSMGKRFSKILTNLEAGAASFAGCAAAKIAAAAIGLTSDAIKGLVCVFTAGIGCVVDALGSAGTTLIGATLKGNAVSIAIKFATPLFVTWFARDMITDIAGEDLGNAIVSGANIYMGNNHKSGGGAPATRASYAAFMNEKNKVDVEYARYQQETLSPFDTSSQYTFLGSLAKRLITFSTTTSNPTNIISTISNMVSDSVVALLPTATAIDISDDLIPESEYEEICPSLASIGVAGDAFCNPYIVSDLSTIDTNPDDIVANVEGSLNDDGSIKPDSPLANYIQYCNGRSSSFGVADRNIANHFTKGEVNSGNDVVDTTSNAIIGAIPIIGDALDIWSNEAQLKKIGWITGESCVIGNNLASQDGVEAVKWSEMRNYQRYVEDQRLLESIDDNYTSTVTAFLEEYEKENPVDNSYEGILARNSGLKKETVVALLDVMEYSNYIANYNPLERYQFAKNNAKQLPQINNANDIDFMNVATVLNNVTYDDLRNRAMRIA